MESKSQSETEVAVLMQATCASTSGKSMVTFQIGCLREDDVQLRIVGNTGTGAFSREWVPLRAVTDVLKAAKAGEITSSHLRPLFAGGSINTPSFLLAVLASEGLVRASRTKRRCYECADSSQVSATIDAWKSSNRQLRPAEPSKKRAAKAECGRLAVNAAPAAPTVPVDPAATMPVDPAPTVPLEAAPQRAVRAIDNIPSLTGKAQSKAPTKNAPRKAMRKGHA